MRTRSTTSALRVATPILAVLLWIGAASVAAQQESVVSTVHNLSVTGPGEIHALRETEVCKFCHIPHSTEVPVPLWGRPLSTAQYEMPNIRSGRDSLAPAPQPDGASRLCLSCHDGTIALGEVLGEARPIAMAGADRLGPGRAGFLGTDLSGSHPISFVVRDEELGVAEDESDMGLRPLGSIRSDADVQLDGDGKMQCTTCHDAHADRYYQPGRVPRFWVKPTIDEVCVTCHALR